MYICTYLILNRKYIIYNDIFVAVRTWRLLNKTHAHIFAHTLTHFKTVGINLDKKNYSQIKCEYSIESLKQIILLCDFFLHFYTNTYTCRYRHTHSYGSTDHLRLEREKEKKTQ